MIDQADIQRELATLGVRPGMVLEVHSSLRRLGWVEGGAAAVVDALQAAVSPGGTLVMSAYPVTAPLPLSKADRARGIVAKVRWLRPERAGRTGMGAIADELRARPDTRLGRGRHRVCAWGADARRQVQGYARLLAADGSVLLLGVGIDRCSSMHVAEARAGLPPEVAACAAVPGGILRDYPAEQWYVQVGGTPVDAWGVVFAQACAAGLVTTGMVGAAQCHLFAARAVVGLYEDRLRTDARGLFGLDSTPSPR